MFSPVLNTVKNIRTVANLGTHTDDARAHTTQHTSEGQHVGISNTNWDNGNNCFLWKYHRTSDRHIFLPPVHHDYRPQIIIIISMATLWPQFIHMPRRQRTFAPSVQHAGITRRLRGLSAGRTIQISICQINANRMCNMEIQFNEGQLKLRACRPDIYHRGIS